MELTACVLQLAVACSFLCSVVNSQANPSNMVSYDERFLLASKAYSKQKWKDCIPIFRQAMEEYNSLEEARSTCLAECSQEVSTAPADYYDDRELLFFHNVIQRATCIKKCEEKIVGILPWGGMPYYLFDIFERREGYNYLQMALFQNGDIREAAKTCTTYSYFNPHNMHIKANQKFYEGHADVTKEDLKSMETQRYRELFLEGHFLYYKEEWKEMTEVFEKALPAFYDALRECKKMCDGPLKYNNQLDFAQAMTRVFMSKMQCRIQCVKKLGDFRSDRIEDFFGTFFHYLQQGYFHLNRSLDAIQASATHVRLEPKSKAAKRNAVFYKQQPGVTGKDFVPREDVLPVIEEREAEIDLYKLVNKLSGDLAGVMAATERGADDEGFDVDEKLLEEDFQKFPVGSNSKKLEEELEPIVVQTAADHNGKERILVDQLLTETQCQQLITLATFGREGDGYSRKSPHTTKEKFEGLHVLDAAKRGVSGEFDRSLSWLYLNASHKVKDMVSKQFNLQTPLYFSYTHLVCRTAKEGMQDGRDDLSHPVHSDNCVLNEATGECNKVPPAYTWRDYSALLYLNGDFDGGHFFFAHSPKDRSPEVLIKPKCGRMVGFSAGKENMHGVQAVTHGKRCAVALWFTLDPTHKEQAFVEAEKVLNQTTTV